MAATEVPSLTEAVLGPDDFLILMPRERLTQAAAQRLKDLMPAALRGRGLVVEAMDVLIARRP